MAIKNDIVKILVVLLAVCFLAANVIAGNHIATLSGEVDADDIFSAIERYYCDLAGDSLNVAVDVSKNNNDIYGQVFKAQVSIIAAELIALGEQIVTLELHQPDGAVSRRHLKIKLKLTAQLAYPGKLIERGKIIAAEDFRKVTVDLDSVGFAGLIFNTDKLIGLQAGRHLSPGSPVRWNQVTQPSLVLKDADVQLLIRSEAFTITTAAMALQSGALGEEIWIRLESSGKRMRAVVIDHGRVSLQ